jgi:hypothetical protein
MIVPLDASIRISLRLSAAQPFGNVVVAKSPILSQTNPRKPVERSFARALIDPGDRNFEKLGNVLDGKQFVA